MWQPRWEKASSAFAKAKAADDAVLEARQGARGGRDLLAKLG
jgi:hypothetical protein